MIHRGLHPGHRFRAKPANKGVGSLISQIIYFTYSHGSRTRSVARVYRYSQRPEQDPTDFSVFITGRPPALVYYLRMSIFILSPRSELRHNGALPPRPITRLTTNSTKKTTNNIQAICVAAPAIPLKPRTPAINPITKNVIDQLSITLTSLNNFGSLLLSKSNVSANRKNPSTSLRYEKVRLTTA